MFFSTTLALTFLGIPALPLSQGPTQHKTLTELQAVHPYSVPGAFTATPEGDFVLVAEGGALAIIDGSVAQPDWSAAARLDPIGSEGIVPVELLLDPDASIGDGVVGDEDLLYVAGGRYGLWALRVDLGGSGPYEVRRIDDSGNLDPQTQNGRRWCDDLAVVTLDGTDYLFALFGKTDGSRLRGYPLDDVRDAFLHPEETGAELSPAFDKHLKRHPAGSSGHQSFAFGMDVDVWNDGTDDVTDFIVAMGYHGLVRVRFFPAGGELQTVFGPIFGDGSAAATSGTHADYYDNLEYKDGDQGTVDRSDPPLFVDVAVDSADDQERRVYVALDHLGWARFDLTGAGTSSCCRTTRKASRPTSGPGRSSSTW